MLLARKRIIIENPKLFFDRQVVIVRGTVAFELFLHFVILNQMQVVGQAWAVDVKPELVAAGGVDYEIVRRCSMRWGRRMEQR